MEEPRIIELPKILDVRGNLSFFENHNQLPFEIQRAYWIYDVPGGEIRGEHAFIKSTELIIALSGSFDVILNDGQNEMKFNLNRSYYGLYVPNLYWRRIENFSTNSLSLIVSSIHYDEKDYIRDFDLFKKIRNEAAQKYRL
ncbi:MAG: FdtA/QdtA family cupin domain-containing protein [Bacteroidota bacterium]